MLRKSRTNKRKRLNVCETFNHASSQDPASDLEFLTGPIDVDDPLVWALLSNRMMNRPFWNRFANSDEVGRKQLLIEERNRLKSDVNSRSKRLILNRLIHACSEMPSTFQQHVQQLIVKIRSQISDFVSPEGGLFSTSQLYEQVSAWRQTQCTRRLFYQESYPSSSIPTLQRLMTNQFMSILHAYRENPHLLAVGDISALNELLQHALMIVVQPCGSDCIAATKYEKVPNGFVAKLKTRLISLLDPIRTKNYLILSNTEIVLQSEEDDWYGDPQESLVYKTRTITTAENAQRTFAYAELKGTECLRLTKLNDKGKPAYNKGLCKLRFQTIFRVTVNGVLVEIPIVHSSQWFGLCSHAKYYSKYLTKVFLTEVNQMHADITPEIHLTVLKEYIASFYRRMTGVEMKVHTEKYVLATLQTFYERFERSGSSPTTPVLFFSWNIYEDLLTKLFTQIRFLGNQLCLAVMYHDNLFRGITSEVDDEKLGNSTLHSTTILLRLEQFTQQESVATPCVIIVKHDGTLTRSLVNHDCLLNDICRYCHSPPVHPLEIVTSGTSLPFCIFRWYYDSGVNRDSLIHADNDTVFHSVDSITHTATQHNLDQSSTEQQNTLQTFRLAGYLTGEPDLTHRAITALQAYFTQWCRRQNITGRLTQISTEATEDTFGANDFPFLHELWFHDNIDHLLLEDHS